VLQVRLVLGTRLVGEQADSGVDAGGAEERRAVTADAGIRVGERDHGAGDAGRDHGLRARRLLADVGARLEGHIEGGAAGSPARSGERFDLGMQLAKPPMTAFTDDHAATNENRAHERIWADSALPPPGERERSLHPAPIVVRRHENSASA
jgi:hypothetical protein